MSNALVGTWIRRFLLEHIVGERNLALQTQASYRDALVLLLPFAAGLARKPVDRLDVEDLSPDAIRRFLAHLEEVRRCSIATRNHRLAAVHSLARFIALHSPEHVAWCSALHVVPFKKTGRPQVPYLDKSEMDALRLAPNIKDSLGFRDYAVLLFFYNTGARADEVARLTIQDLDLGRSSSVKILGKGRKTRFCPLWPETVKALKRLTAGRTPEDPVFISRGGESHHAVRPLRTRPEICRRRRQNQSRHAQETHQPAHPPPHRRRPPPPLRRRYQHHPRLAGACFSGHHIDLRRGRF
jgi:integrase/recombinase XerD